MEATCEQINLVLASTVMIMNMIIAYICAHFGGPSDLAGKVTACHFTVISDLLSTALTCLASA
jgi:hypothetical protein